MQGAVGPSRGTIPYGTVVRIVLLYQSCWTEQDSTYQEETVRQGENKVDSQDISNIYHSNNGIITDIQ